MSGASNISCSCSMSSMMRSTSIGTNDLAGSSEGSNGTARGVPLSMSKIHREFLDADPSGRSHAADVLVREEPEDEEDEEDDGEEEDDEDKEDDDGYSE